MRSLFLLCNTTISLENKNPTINTKRVPKDLADLKMIMNKSIF